MDCTQPLVTGAACCLAQRQAHAQKGQGMSTKGTVSRAAEQHYTEPTEWAQEGDSMAMQKNGVGDHLFDVTCVIGSVRRGGDLNPTQAAFLLIADHDSEGRFTFPQEDGTLVHVTVEKVHPTSSEALQDASWTP